MALEERLLDAVLDLTKEVHTMGTKIDDKIALLIEANKLKEEEQDKRIGEVELITKAVKPFANLIINKQYVLIGVFTITVLTGFSLGQLIVTKVNDMTGLTELSEIVKKNSSTLKHLCTYFKAECK
jgi:hypothetical protein